MKYEMLKCQKMFSKIMRKCTGSGTESGQAWPGPAQSPARAVAKMPRTVDLYCQCEAAGHTSGHRSHVTRHLMGLVVENIKRLLGPSLSRMIAPFFRFAILTLVLAGLGPV